MPIDYKPGATAGTAYRSRRFRAGRTIADVLRDEHGVDIDAARAAGNGSAVASVALQLIFEIREQIGELHADVDDAALKMTQVERSLLEHIAEEDPELTRAAVSDAKDKAAASRRMATATVLLSLAVLFTHVDQILPTVSMALDPKFYAAFGIKFEQFAVLLAVVTAIAKAIGLDGLGAFIDYLRRLRDTGKGSSK